jgi:hypothetical protein
MGIALDLSVEERHDDRVVVALVLAPDGSGPARIDGAAVGLVVRGDPVAPRTLLPIQGSLTGALATTLELRTDGPLPEGTEVLASVWWDAEQVSVQVPAHPATCVVDHIRGVGCSPAPPVRLAAVAPARVEALDTAFPGVLSRLRPLPPSNVIDADDAADDVDAFQEAYHLDDEAADWLRELLHEDDAV